MSNRDWNGGGRDNGGVPHSPPAHKPGRKPPPPGETRRDTFVRLANARVNAALDAISLIGNLANRKNYSFRSDDVDRIEEALFEGVRMMIAAFRSPKDTMPGFRLLSDREARNDY